MARPRRQKKEKDLKDDEFIDGEEDVEVDDDAPPTIDPYAVLGLEQDATADDVKKAYRKQALLYHPDKSQDSNKSNAVKKFQEIAFAYAVLSDERRRKRYNLTGSTAETLDHSDEDFDWLSFYREQFENIVTEENIQIIKDEYKGSAEEREALLDAYTRYKGNLDKIYNSVMCSDVVEDDDRFRQILDEEIAKGTIESFPTYERQNNDQAREKVKAAERKRVEEFKKRNEGNVKGLKKEGKKGDMNDLAALIKQRQQSRAGGFFDHLEAKYTAKEDRKGKKRAKPMDEPPEELFQANIDRMKRSRGNAREARKKIVVDEEDDVSEDMGVSDEDDAPPKASRKTKAKAKGRARTKARM
ncbi:DnaJ-domain-containing protein [Lindgomyces ingoldianus]|uniref:DnaJ-domain-containing protein n=1 Tax=Lindgomyces ingoldianus TaxID=673940 RepID=A0ACB6QQ29_9PLEO|nr:DnaJ-domain-containing protein [Lindgomyces ingoldianus]KAF2468640.1 DnaJ-domain-containing protein [Lindgomyces ingoldianus]